MRVEGEVRLETIIDRTGALELRSIRMAASTHDLFTTAVRTAVTQWRFSPPVLDGRDVRTAVLMMLSFSLPSDQAGPWRDVTSVASDATGIRVTVGTEPIPRDGSIAANPADIRAATIAALSALMPQKTAVIDGGVCVAWNDSGRVVPADVMTRLQALYPPLRNADKCPPTYASQIPQLDSLGRPLRPPPGAVDPAWIEVNSGQVWTRDVYVFYGSMSRGTFFTHYKCIVRRDPPSREWKARCVQMGTSVA